MDTYVKYISESEVNEPPINYEGIMNYNLDIPRLIQDGYKKLIPVEIPESVNRLLHIEYREYNDNIEEIIVYDETQEEADEREKQDRIRNKTQEINEKISELEIMATKEILNNNIENIQVYKDVINGLEETRDNLS